jgi:hypothetical protein
MDQVKLVVKASDQRATLFVNGAPRKTYVISTATKGLGNVSESCMTPTGLLRVCEKIGGGMEPGTVFVDRVPTGRVWKPGEDGAGQNLILTRILWLEGIEPHNTNTKDRTIYLHGTWDEANLGKPKSLGCINFSNKDIVEVYDLMPVGAIVEVVP